MIQVEIDEEIVKEFKDRTTYVDDFIPGASLFLGLYGEWWFSHDETIAFKNGATENKQYDDEFTEWLKIHRPEVFL